MISVLLFIYIGSDNMACKGGKGGKGSKGKGK